MKKNIIVLIVVIIAGAIGWYLAVERSTGSMVAINEEEAATVTKPPAKEPKEPVIEATTTPVGETLPEGQSNIGTSVEGRDIIAYHYGTGETELLFVGGIHGGYEWNTVLVAYELMDYLDANPNAVPENVTVTVIPVMNPDGLNKVIGTDGRFAKASAPTSEAEMVKGRFNANGVDLNRNFDCDWQTTGIWKDTVVDGGSAAFSEPESKAVKNYVEANKPAAVVVWYSAAGGVFSSSCYNGVSTETKKLTNLFANASGYKAFEEFDFYEITGDMVNWLAKEGVPAISVLLSTHTDVEWSKNRAGVEALLTYYAE